MCVTNRKMSPEELLKDLDECTGPCGRMCLSCPESRYVAEIREVLVGLMEENKRLRTSLRDITGEVDFI